MSTLNYLSAYIFLSSSHVQALVLTKMRNNLKQPTMTCNKQETTWNDLQRARNNLKWPTTTYNGQEMTWNDLQRARNNLKWPTTSKKQHGMTYKDLKRLSMNKKRPGNNLQWTRNEKKKMQNDRQQADFLIILQYGANSSLLWYIFHPTFGCNHLSLASWRIMVIAEL